MAELDFSFWDVGGGTPGILNRDFSSPFFFFLAGLAELNRVQLDLCWMVFRIYVLTRRLSPALQLVQGIKASDTVMSTLMSPSLL